jgi:hypothetical protein
MVGFGHFHNNTFVRLVTINAENTEQDILNFFKIFLLEIFFKYFSFVKNKSKTDSSIWYDVKNELSGLIKLI